MRCKKIILLCLCFLMSCSRSGDQIIKSTEINKVIPSPTAVLPTETKFILTPTISPSETGTPKPIPTLQQDEAKNRINVFIQSENCKLPCWMGLTPGISTFSEIANFAGKLGAVFPEENHAEEAGFAGIFIPNTENYRDIPSNIEGNPIFTDVQWNEGVITTILIQPNEIPEFLTVDHVFENLGYPDLIYFESQFRNWMGFILEYTDEGFMYRFVSQASKNTMCFNDTSAKKITLGLYNPEDPISVSQIEIRLNFGDVGRVGTDEPGYSTEEIMDRILTQDCVSYEDFINW